MRSIVPTRSHRARWHHAIALGAAAALVLGACGGDDDDGEASDEAAAFCDAYVAANEATAGEEGDPTPALEEAQATAPEEIADAVNAMIENAPGDEELPPQEFFDANVEVGEYVEDNCGFETVTVTAQDYAFEGLPDEIEAGTVLVRFENEGDELHELALFRMNEGEDRSINELLELPEEEAMTAVTPVNGFAFAAPGGTFYTTYALEAGRHGAVCFIPTGLTPEALESGEIDEEAPPHFAQGMAGEFEVTA